MSATDGNGLADAVTVPASEAEVPAPGATFGRFTTAGVLGVGGMGVVFAAHDPELDRKVAIKVLHAGGLADDARTRLRGEAQAMAKLAHPNTVTVYEVGTAGDRMFVAMELVDGQTLRAWLAEPRTWRAIVAMFGAAGRGLEAAHHAGLVHRDFKPENVLIGPDGRPRVSDFGLAASRADAGVAGTPAYMAPEQWRGDDVDARSNEFAFCVALWAAVWGERPFGGESTREIRDEVLADRVRAAPSRAGIPRWLEPALRRGLAPEPALRWPTLGALLDVLDRRLASRRRATLAIAGATAVAGAGIAVAVMLASAPGATCGPPDVDAVWGPARRAQVDATIRTVVPRSADERIAAITALLDRQLADYRAVHVGTCRATRDGTQSEHLLDLRMRCLARWLDRTDGAVAAIAGVRNAKGLEAAIGGAYEVGPLAACSDATALEAAMPPPPTEAGRAEAEAIEKELKAINVARRVSLDGLVPRVEALIARARALDHLPTLALALGVRWRLAIDVQDTHAAVTAVREQIDVASRAHNDREVAHGWGMLVRLTGVYLAHPDEAKTLIAAARAAVARAGGDPELRAQEAGYESDVLNEIGDGAGALAVLADSRRELEAAGANTPGSPLAPLLAQLLRGSGEAHQSLDQLAEAAADLRASLVLLDRAYGRDTLRSAALYLGLAQIERDAGDFADAERDMRRSVEIREPMGPTPSLAFSLIGLADVLGKAHRADEAIPIAERAAEMAGKTLPADDMSRALVMTILADSYDGAGRKEQALAIYKEALATATRTHALSTNVAGWWNNRGDIEHRLNRCPEAIESFHTAAQLGDKVEGPKSHYIGDALVGEGACLHELGRDAEAIPVLERAMTFTPPTVVLNENLLSHGLLGMLLVETGKDPVRGLELVRDAHTKLVDRKADPAMVAKLASWLAKHP